MTPAWTQRQEALLSDCTVSPDVFDHMIERLRAFVVPYQHVLETEAGKRNVHLYLQGLLSHLPRKNAEDIATLVDVERLVMQEFIGTAPWDHRLVIEVLIAQVVERLGEPDGIIAFDPSSFPKRGTHSVGVKRQWCGHRGKVDNCQVGVYMGYVSRHDHALLDFRLSLPQEWARDEQRRHACHVPEEVEYHTRPNQCLEMLHLWGEQVPHGWVTGDDELGRHTQFRHALRERGRALCARGALHHHDARPGGAVARVPRAWTAPEGPVAIGDGVAASTPPACMEAVDGARWRERAGGHRDGHPPCADAARTQTDGTRRVAGGHPPSALGRPARWSRRARRMPPIRTLAIAIVTTCTSDRGVRRGAGRRRRCAELARVIKAGACIEASFKRGKGEAGMDEYQVRTWQGWHHHMALSLIAVWFLIGETHRGQQVDAGLDLATSTLWAERAPAGGVLHAQHRLHLSPRTAPITAQRVGPILPSSHP